MRQATRASADLIFPFWLQHSSKVHAVDTSLSRNRTDHAQHGRHGFACTNVYISDGGQHVKPHAFKPYSRYTIHPH